MQLAIFDLDNTLLAGDSDHAWGQFLADIDAVDGAAYAQQNQIFYEEYQRGTLDIDAFLRFSLAPLAKFSIEQLHAWREQFVAEKIAPMVTDKAKNLVEHHRQRGDEMLIITATNAFVTQPIAELFGIEHLLATQPSINEGRYTGGYDGTPTFQAGKQTALTQWLHVRQLQPTKTWFYSDSQNDLPLLKAVDHPVAVDPDKVLREYALTEGWPIISLRD
ncbi:MAG: phosphoserine phosphatase [Halothiobacillus sp. 13-55-253]|jgi:HAD superfamily hydrolase (TIGR01490 family)|nr:MAG: phosphoserine phosphatase [Halothiobacillus sp. 13-55-253]